MKCLNCRAENKSSVMFCARCGRPLSMYWQPSWNWILKALSLIYAVLAVLYFTLRNIV